MPKSYGDIVKAVFVKAANGCKLSELSRYEQKVADRLATQGKLSLTPIRGDWIVNRND
jgi:hypothetical protein